MCRLLVHETPAQLSKHSTVYTSVGLLVVVAAAVLCCMCVLLALGCSQSFLVRGGRTRSCGGCGTPGIAWTQCCKQSYSTTIANSAGTHGVVIWWCVACLGAQFWQPCSMHLFAGGCTPCAAVMMCNLLLYLRHSVLLSIFGAIRGDVAVAVAQNAAEARKLVTLGCDSHVQQPALSCVVLS